MSNLDDLNARRNIWYSSPTEGGLEIRGDREIALANKVERLWAKVERLQRALRDQNRWAWELVGEPAADDDTQISERFGLEPGDLDPEPGAGEDV